MEFSVSIIHPIGHHIPDRGLDAIRSTRMHVDSEYIANVELERGPGAGRLDFKEMTRFTNDVVLIKHIVGQLSVFIGWFVQARLFVGWFVHGTLRDQQKVTILQFERRSVPAEWHNAPRPVHTPAEVPLRQV